MYSILMYFHANKKALASSYRKQVSKESETVYNIAIEDLLHLIFIVNKMHAYLDSSWQKKV